MTIPTPFLQRKIGAGDLVKAATSAVGIKPCTPCQKRAEKMNRALTFSPRQPAEKPRPQTWTAPPETPEGWEVVTACDHHALYRNGQKYIVWDLLNGQYRNSHTFCCGSIDGAIREFERRCHS